MVEQITLYTSKFSAFAQRAELALEEVKAEYTKYEIDLRNKPVWYATKVNPVSKVPAVTYGGPHVSPDDPSPDSTKLAESLVLMEFIADLFPSSDLLPKDPVARAKTRFFINFISTKFNPAVIGFVMGDGPVEPALEAFDTLQAYLPPLGQGRFVLGDMFSLADISIAPFLIRCLLLTERGVGRFEEEVGKKLWGTLQTPNYQRLRQYADYISERQSWKNTYCGDDLTELHVRKLVGSI